MATLKAVKTIGTVSIDRIINNVPSQNFSIVRLTDGRVAYVFDPTVELGASASGKSTLISTTKGALRLDGLPVISMNVYR
jgi:hypothetical protein